MATIEQPTSSTSDAALTAQHISELNDAFNEHPTALLMQKAVTKNHFDEVAMDREVVTTTSN